MTVRLIIKTDCCRVAGVGVPETYFRTFDVELPEIERALLSGGYNQDGTYEVSHVIGAEVVIAPVGEAS